MSPLVKRVKRAFKKAVKSLGKKYGQDAVLTQTKKTGTVSATRKGGLGKDKQGRNVKRFTAGTMKPGRPSSDGDTKIKGQNFYLRIMTNKPYDDSNWREESKGSILLAVYDKLDLLERWTQESFSIMVDGSNVHNQVEKDERV